MLGQSLEADTSVFRNTACFGLRHCSYSMRRIGIVVLYALTNWNVSPIEKYIFLNPEGSDPGIAEGAVNRFSMLT